MAKSSNENKEELIFTLGEKVIKFRVGEFDKNLDLDSLLRIDYQNLIAEILTFPVVVNRLGILAAQMDNKVSEAKIDLSVFEAKAKNKIRDEWEGGKKPTINEVDDALIENIEYIKKKKKYFKVIQNKEIFYSVYQSAKDKSEKLNKLSLTLRHGDIDEAVIQSQLNRVYFNIKNGAIKGE